jgi:hypothetical protein
MKCPNGHGKLKITRTEEKMKFRGVDILIPAEQYSCPVCNIKAGTIEQTSAIQRAILKAYRKDLK